MGIVEEFENLRKKFFKIRVWEVAEKESCFKKEEEEEAEDEIKRLTDEAVQRKD